MTAPVIHAPDQDAKRHTVSFVLPKDVSIKDIPLLQRYKQFGNSVVVNVVEAIFAEIKRHWLSEPKHR
jgi:site-specific DNA-cytosine methylase